MTNEQKEQARKRMHRLLDIVLDANGFEERQRDTTGTKPTIFFEYMGHINAISIDIIPTGWKSEETEPQRNEALWCELDRLTDEAVKKAAEKCRRAE